MAPFSFSLSVSFGSAEPLVFGNGQRQGQSEDDETRVSQTFVIGAFLAIFVAQVGVNLIHGVRSGRFRREVLRREALREMGAGGVEQEPPGEDVQEEVREIGADGAGQGQPEPEQEVQTNVEGDTEHASAAG